MVIVYGVVLFALIMMMMMRCHSWMLRKRLGCEGREWMKMSAKSGSSVPIEEWSISKLTKLPRMYVNQPLSALGTITVLDVENSNYVLNVMRLREGDFVRVFNDQSDEYVATILDNNSDSRKSRRRLSNDQVSVRLSRFLRAQDSNRLKPKLSLWFSPVKKDKMKLIIEKATELGVDEFQPIITQNTNVDITGESMQATLCSVIVQSAEQSERMTIPPLKPPMLWSNLVQSLTATNNLWKNESTLLLVCRERTAASESTLLKTLLSESTVFDQIYVLIGPEGGFTQQEMEEMDRISEILQQNSQNSLTQLSKLRFQCVSLGNQVLRAETAAIASLSLLSLWRDNCATRR